MNRKSSDLIPQEHSHRLFLFIAGPGGLVQRDPTPSHLRNRAGKAVCLHRQMPMGPAARPLLDLKPGRGEIGGLLPCSLRYIDGSAYLYYDITSRQNISHLYSNRCITREWLTDFVWSLKRIQQELQRFLLDIRNILWYPEQIFQDLESNIFSFVYGVSITLVKLSRYRGLQCRR